MNSFALKFAHAKQWSNFAVAVMLLQPHLKINKLLRKQIQLKWWALLLEIPSIPLSLKAALLISYFSVIKRRETCIPPQWVQRLLPQTRIFNKLMWSPVLNISSAYSISQPSLFQRKLLMAKDCTLLKMLRILVALTNCQVKRKCKPKSKCC